MAKFVVTLAVETDEPKGSKPPTKKAIREAVEYELRDAIIGEPAAHIYIDKARVRAIRLG
jgi:hypothetical protein